MDLQISMGVLKKCETKGEDMDDICAVVQASIPGHQDSEEAEDVHPIRTAFEGDYLTFERIKSSQIARRNGRTPSKQFKCLVPRLAEFHNQAEFMKVCSVFK